MDLRYIAGLIDAKGILLINERKQDGKKVYQAQVEINHKALSSFLQKHFGGSIIDVKGNKRWILTGYDNISLFLSQVSPYLHIKKKQAELLMAFCRSRKINSKKRKEERSYTDDEINICDELRILHKRDNK